MNYILLKKIFFCFLLYISSEKVFTKSSSFSSFMVAEALKSNKFAPAVPVSSQVNISNNDAYKSDFISSVNKDISSYYRMFFRKTFEKRFKCLFFIILGECCFCNKAIYSWFMKKNNLKQKIKKWCYRIFNIFVFIEILILGAFLKQKLFKNIRLYK